MTVAKGVRWHCLMMIYDVVSYMGSIAIVAAKVLCWKV